MLVELNGKSGRLCEAATSGQTRCPLLVRPTSEDVITSNLFQVLGVINPRWWLPDLLNYGLGAPRFRRQHFRGLKIDLWKSRGYFPREMLPWKEGRTEVDVTISWENPATTVFFEMKYLSPLTKSTAGDDGSSGYPSDQLIRNVRVGLLEAGWVERNELFAAKPRDFCQLMVGLNENESLVDRYRNTEQLRSSIPFEKRLRGLPEPPFIGQLSYSSICHILKRNKPHFGRTERHLISDLTQYLNQKVHLRRDSKDN